MDWDLDKYLAKRAAASAKLDIEVARQYAEQITAAYLEQVRVLRTMNRRLSVPKPS